MRWFWQKKDTPPEHPEEGVREEIEAPKADIPTVVSPETELPWGPRAERLGVESLYLDFGVSPGYADGKSLSFPYPYTVKEFEREIRDRPSMSLAKPVTTASFPSSSTSEWKAPSRPVIDAPPRTPAENCNAPLYLFNSKPENPFFCWLPLHHEGKHGKEDVEYLHPDLHPLWVYVERDEHGNETFSYRENGIVRDNHRV